MFAQMLKDNAELFPQQVAIEWKNEGITWGELFQRTESVANGLRTIGISQGSTIALLLPNTPDFIITFLAGAVLGAVVVPVNPQFKGGELKFIFNQCRVSAVVVTSQRVGEYRGLIDCLDWPVELVVSGDRPTEEAMTISTLLLAGRGQTQGKLNSQDPFVYQYSSGSTGLPKRVSRTHGMCLIEAENIATTLKLTPEDSIFCAVPLFHTYGMGNCFFASLKSGARLILMGTASPFKLYRDECLRLMEQTKPTIFFGVPYMYELMAESARQTDLSSLRLAICSGTPLLMSTYNQVYDRFGLSLRQLYGCTEAGCIAVNVNLIPEDNFNSVGLPINGVDLKLVDEDRKEIATGKEGEVAVSTMALTNGYFQQEQLNDRVFVGGYFYTGDLGHINADGGLVLTGRKKAYIEVAGNKVDPEEIEAVLVTHELVQEAVVVAIQSSDSYNDAIKAVLVTSSECTAAEVISFCRDKLAPFKVPSTVEFIAEIPKSPLGKVLRKYLL